MIGRLLLLFCFVSGTAWATTRKVYQNWADTTTTGMWAADSLEDGDVLEFQENITVARSFILPPEHNRITIDGQNYTLTYDTMWVPTVVNGDFESGGGWNFTNADSARVVPGQWHCPSTLWDGDSSLAVGLPCNDQTIKSAGIVTLLGGNGGRRYALSAMAYNGDNAGSTCRTAYGSSNARMSIGCLYGTDTLTMNTYPEGAYARGWYQLTSEVIVPGDSSWAVYILLRITGAGEADSGYLYFDAVKVTSAHNCGIIVGADSTKNWSTGYMTGKQDYNGNGTSVRWISGIPGTYGANDTTWIKDLTVVEEYGSWGGAGVLGISALNIVLIDVDITTKGNCNFVYFSRSATNDTLQSCELIMSGENRLKRDWQKHGYININGVDNYSYGCRVAQSYMRGTDGWGILTKTADGSYANAVIDSNTMYGSSRFSNGFLIEDAGECPAYIRYNWMRTDSTGGCGRGIHVAGKKSGVANERGKIIGNTIIVTDHANNNQEYASTPAVYAVQFEDVPGGCEVRNNTLIAYGDYTGGIGTDHCGLRIAESTGDNHDIDVVGNTIKGIARGNYRTVAVWYHGAHNTGGTDDLRVDSNTIVFNYIGVREQCCGDSVRWLDNEFQVDSTEGIYRQDGELLCISKDDDGLDVSGTQFVNNTYPDTVVAHWFKYGHAFDDNRGDDASVEMSWLYQWTCSLDVNDGEGDPVNGATVDVIDSVSGDTVYTGTTGASGVLTDAIISEFRDSAQTSTYDVERDREYYRYYFIANDGEIYDTVITAPNEAWELVAFTLGSFLAQAVKIKGMTIRGTTIQ